MGGGEYWDSIPFCWKIQLLHLWKSIWDITTPLPDWDNIQTFPKNLKVRAPLREGYKKFLLFQCIYQAANFFWTSFLQICKLILYPALLWWTSFYLLLTEIQPSCFPFAAHRAYLWKKETYQLSNNVKLKKKKNLTDLKSIFWLQFWPGLKN